MNTANKMRKSFLSLTILRIAILLLFVGVVSALECQEINQSGVYIMDQDVSVTDPNSSTCFTIATDNVVLQGNGKEINYDGRPFTGVYVANVNNVTLEGLEINEPYNGIVVSGNDVLVDDTKVYFAEKYGIQITGLASNVVIEDSLFDDSQDFDLWVNDQNCDVTVNNVEGSGSREIGFYTSASNTATVVDKEFSELILCGADAMNFDNIKVWGSPTINNNGVLLYGADGFHMKDSNIASNKFGIEIYDSNAADLDNVTIENNAGHGLYIYDSSGHEFNDLVLRNNIGMGLYVEDSENIEIADSLIEYSWDLGAFIIGTTDSTIRSSNITYNDAGGVLIHTSDNIRVDDCIVDKNNDDTVSSLSQIYPTSFGFGISSWDSTVVELQDNLIEQNDNEGILFYKTTLGEVERNTVQNNGYGIMLRGITHNGDEGNTDNVFVGNVVKNNVDDVAYLFDSSSNNMIRDSVIETGTKVVSQAGYYLLDSLNNVLLNVTYDDTTQEELVTFFPGYDPELIRKWYLNVDVEDQFGAPVSNANVDVYYGATHTADYVAGVWNPIDHILNKTGKFTPIYTIEATAPDCSDNMTQLSILQNLDLTLSLNCLTNHAPTAIADSYFVTENGVLHVYAPGILFNDSDVDADSLSARLITGTANGVLNFSADEDGAFNYTPNPGFSGIDLFSYVANDGQNDSVRVFVTINVTPINHQPTATDLSVSVNEGGQVEITLNCTDSDGDALTYSVASQPAHGTLSPVVGDKVDYTPVIDYDGDDAFTYRCNDGNIFSNYGTVNITVIDVPFIVSGITSNLPLYTNGSQDENISVNFTSSVYPIAVSFWIYNATGALVNYPIAQNVANALELPVIYTVSSGTVEGNYTINMSVTHNADTMYYELGDFIVDKTAPGLDITSPLTGDIVNGDKVIVFIDDEPTNPECSINNIAWDSCVSGVTTLNDLTGFAGLPDGDFELLLRDTDLAGNSNIDNRPNITKDTSIPNVTNVMTDPAMPLANNGTEQNVSVNFTSNEYPVNVTFNLFNESGALVNSQGPTTVTSASETVTFTVPAGLTDGNYTLNMTVADSIGNEVEVTIGTIVVDTTMPPFVQLSDDEYSVLVGSDTQLNILANDTAMYTSIWLYDIASAPVYGTATSTLDGKAVIYTSGSATATDYFTYNVIDSNNNTYGVATVTVHIVENSAPVINLSGVSAAGTVGVQSVLDLSPYVDDSDNDSLTYSSNVTALGGSINASGVIIWTPTTAGTYTISVSVCDDYQCSTDDFTVTVSAQQNNNDNNNNNGGNNNRGNSGRRPRVTVFIDDTSGGRHFNVTGLPDGAWDKDEDLSDGEVDVYVPSGSDGVGDNQTGDNETTLGRGITGFAIFGNPAMLFGWGIIIFLLFILLMELILLVIMKKKRQGREASVNRPAPFFGMVK